MRNTDIDKLLESNNIENINLYFSHLLSKTKDLDKENNKIFFFLLLLVFIYYLTDFASIETINLGFFTIKNVESIKVFIPLIFSFIIFRLVIINSHKTELKKIIKKIAYSHFRFNNQYLDTVFTDDFSRSVMPVSIYDELNKFNFKTKVGCINLLIIIPLIAVPTLAISICPFIIEWFWLKPMIIEFGNLKLISKAIVILTIWILLLSLFYSVKTMALGFNEEK